MTYMGPYGETAWLYRAAGWAGVLPLPPGAKWPPPSGYTGWAGIEPSGADVQAWVEDRGSGNIGLRLPSGVYGLDVDGYGEKGGAAALARLVEACGPLPATWTVSSRDDGVSGIRLFRAELPPGYRWRDEPGGHGAGIEAIHRGHRYAVTWPSVHPETGRKYVWHTPDGLLADGAIPSPAELPELPTTWIAALSQLGEARTGEAAGHDETVAMVTGWREGEPCPRVTVAHERALSALRAAAGGDALHPAIVAATYELACLGHEGHAGVRRALAEHYAAAIEVRASRGLDRGNAEGEWWRAMRGAVGKLVRVSARERCDCDLWNGAGLTFDPSDFMAPTLAQPDDGAREDARGVREAEAAAMAAAPPGVADLVASLRARLLSAAQVRELRPPPAVVDGLLTLDSESWLIAKPGSFKTFVALDIAGHVGAGREWMGRQVRQGNVLYLAAEGAGGMGKRVRAWEQRNGEMRNVHFLPTPVQAAREEHWAALVEVARELDPVLIVLDTQARITVGLQENDNSEMGQFIDAIGRLRRATGACVLTVHHLGRNGQAARGASAIDGAQDSELRLDRTADLRVVLHVDKQRHLSDDVRVELELFACALDGGGDSLVVGAPLGSVEQPDWRANLSANQAVLVEVMTDIFPALGATKAELKSESRKRARSARDGARMEPMGDSSFRRAWDALVDAGRLLRVDGTQRYVLETPAETPDWMSA